MGADGRDVDRRFYVAPGAIPWLKLKVMGGQLGPDGGAPTPGDCAAPTDIGRRVFVPYATDYVCYR